MRLGCVVVRSFLQAMVFNSELRWGDPKSGGPMRYPMPPFGEYRPFLASRLVDDAEWVDSHQPQSLARCLYLA